MWERMSEKRNEGGFTLIELLIVIIILAILAAIVVFAVGSTGQNAKTAACNSDAKTMETALESYKATVGYYPGDPNLTTGGSTGPASWSFGQTWANASPNAAATHPVFGLLGNNGITASNTSAATPPVADATPSAGGTWTAPNGATVGPFLRQLPNSTHYQIVTDGKGGVFVFPPTPVVTAATIAAGTTVLGNANNFDVTPTICASAPV
jgi:prepilin-type N-terminal cleavage/methylation domain-containing protein